MHHCTSWHDAPTTINPFPVEARSSQHPPLLNDTISLASTPSHVYFMTIPCQKTAPNLAFIKESITFVRLLIHLFIHHDASTYIPFAKTAEAACRSAYFCSFSRKKFLLQLDTHEISNAFLCNCTSSSLVIPAPSPVIFSRFSFR